MWCRGTADKSAARFLTHSHLSLVLAHSLSLSILEETQLLISSAEYLSFHPWQQASEISGCTGHIKHYTDLNIVLLKILGKTGEELCQLLKLLIIFLWNLFLLP